jgi:hypothetical protein
MDFFSSIRTTHTHDLGICTCDLLRVLSFAVAYPMLT